MAIEMAITRTVFAGSLLELKLTSDSDGLFAPKGFFKVVDSVGFNHNGTKIVSASSGGTIKVWDAGMPNCQT